MISLICGHCNAIQAGLSEDWNALSTIPWCKTSFGRLWKDLPVNFTREDYVVAHAKQFPEDFRAQDKLLIQLGLAQRCQCNTCAGRRDV